MPEPNWLQRALKSAVHETNAVDDRIGLARLAILERLISAPSTDRKDEDSLFEALDELRALDWERLSSTELATVSVR